MNTPLEFAVAERIRAVMLEFKLENYRQLGALIGATNGTVSNWANALNLPRVPEMIALCENTGVTLDWVYRGQISTMDPALGIRLARRVSELRASLPG